MGLEKKFETYTNDLCKQIRNKDVHASIRLEINDHLHTLKEEAMRTGLSEEEAIDQALTYIGDAAILGKQLNETHKAPIDVKTILLVLGACLFGLLVMYYLQFHSAFTNLRDMKVFNKSLGFYLFGALLMFSLSTFDYRRLFMYSWHLYIATHVALLFSVLFGVKVNGVPYLSLNYFNINLIDITPFLLAISFAGIFQSWDWRDRSKSWLGVGVLSLPIILLYTTGALSTIIISMIVCIAIMHASTANLKQIIIFSVVASIYPIVNLLFHSQEYTLFSLYIAPGLGTTEGLHVTSELIPDVHTDLIFAYIIYSFGWVAGITIFMLFVFFICRVLSTAKSVKLAYGRMLITGLAATFATKFILSILTNLGLFPFLLGVSIPFMSFGGSHILLEMMAVGLFLSIYRRRRIGDIFWQDMKYNS
ncbi:FtsW/RodA/SpoVE family cell cycle protein [Bacillus sp. NPDC077027]|uniref:FtsW/RodA/SpoVE family cell cycle protein n=1 Tax=Bacillus sp. NPDC077027 TaxID=3390548 RepID=UPI003D058FDB